MNNYRDDMRELHKETKWTFWKFFPFIIIVVVIGFALNSLGLFGKTAVEREVFENSYQRTEAIKTQIATDEAALAQIEEILLDPMLDETTRFNLEAQARAAKVRIATAKGKK